MYFQISSSENTTSHFCCSVNAAYDTVGSTEKRSAQANVPCSENVAYATVHKVEDNIQNISIGPEYAAMYEEAEV